MLSQLALLAGSFVLVDHALLGSLGELALGFAVGLGITLFHERLECSLEGALGLAVTHGGFVGDLHTFFG